ncbi:hypothetical protein N7517_010456 [Penicillium concentricum]|uniref:Uncharacterized protein n=1 Tax=Penicillium concentricum TaxID=293559 RepID=A0A9W9R8U8_9EURO|nr:uncharacterized protein N7517_010456 [Penicillium concentricum]KAJ5355847.1 hypothetical protein N7517_010456 [Penicillium concentricum]
MFGSNPPPREFAVKAFDTVDRSIYLQLVHILLSGFDTGSLDGRDILQDPRFTHPKRDVGSDRVARADDVFFTPLLSGKKFISSFFMNADPDPNSALPAPTRPSHDWNPGNSFLPSTGKLQNASKRFQPTTLFIFTDLSIGSAGM